MSSVPRAVLASLLLILLLVSQAPAEPLPTDPAIVTGELENGLRYVIRKHSNPPGRAVMWIHMHTGSLNETDRQRGIAHYLEHMAFNGSENFKPATLVPFFESMGMTFGRDQNAFTSFDQTTYQLTLPKADEQTLGKGMMFFADVVSRLSLLPEEVNSERQIILEERRRGLGARRRTNDYVMERLIPGSLFGFREPIGLEKTILEMKPQDFRDYYQKWYAPSNATLIVVADADPEAVVKVIKQQFGDEPAKPRPAPQPVNVKPYEKSFAIVTSDPELRSAEVRFTKIEPARPPVTTVELWREELVKNLGESMMNDRLNERGMEGRENYIRASVSAGDLARAIHQVTVNASTRPEKWQAGLESVAQELQRAREFGFTRRELDRVKKDLIAGAERAAENEASITAGPIISRLNGAVASGGAIMSPTQRLELLNKVLPTITLDEIAAKFKQEFDPQKVAFVAILPTSANLPTEQELLDIGTKALAATPTQREDKGPATQPTELISNPPAPGSIAQEETHEGTKVYSAWLSNNVRLHYRFMDDEKDSTSISIRLIGGPLLETAENRGVTQAAELAWSRAATQHLKSAEIREFMTGRKVSVRGGGGFGGFGGRGGGRRGGGGGGGGGDSVGITVSGPNAELETGLQLAYLLLTEPKIEPAAFTQFQTRLRDSLQEEVTNPMQMGTRLTQAALYPDSETRLRPLTVEQLDRLTLESAQSWLDKLITESPIEVVMVGDLPKDKAIELANKYIGSLPSRPRVEPKLYADLRKVQRPPGPRVVEKEVETPTQQAYVYSGFYGADETNREDVRALSMAARILSMRMVKEVREQEQLVYSIGAASRAATTYPGFGVFSAAAPTDPQKVPALVAKLTSMYEKFAKEGPSDQEIEIAKKQFANTYNEQIKQPSFWTQRLNNLEFRGMSLDELVREPSAYQALTAQQVKDAFAKYYAKENTILVVVKPKPGPTTNKTASAGD